MSLKSMVFMIASMAVSSAFASAAEWPQWRGPLLNGSSPETNLPSSWTKTEHVQWSTSLPGKSGATPVIFGDDVFVPSPDADKNIWLYSLQRANGKVRWRQLIGQGDRTRNKNNFASPSAVADSDRVIAMSGSGQVSCFDKGGGKIWERDLAKEYGSFAQMWLYGGSPLLFEGKLYITVIQRNPPTYSHAMDDKPSRDSYLLCLDPVTGKDIWRHVRQTDAQNESMEAYTTPYPYTYGPHPELVVVGADYVTGHDLATGNEIWRFGSMNKRKRGDLRIISSAVAVPGYIFATAPKRGPLMAIKAGQSGSLDQPAWSFTEFTPDVCTPLVYQGKLFVLDGDRQMMTALVPETGVKIAQTSLGVRETFSASPTGADGKLYNISESGTVVVLSSLNLEKIATFKMGEEPCLSSIAVAHGKIFVRTAQNLYCVGN